MSPQKSVCIIGKEHLLPTEIPLPSSKSESNRALIINAFVGGNLHNLSDARDTQTMIRLLKSSEKELDVLDAGTTMRFLLAYCALTGKQKILTGTQRMCERPVGILVDALRQIGADVRYLKSEGFPPVETLGFSDQKNHEISIRGDVSSQYISALMMLAPILPKGLRIHLTGKVASKPYLVMTLELMKNFGANIIFGEDHTITIDPTGYKPASFTVESDWSGASYWFGIVALAKEAKIALKGLRKDSLQGDKQIIEIMKPLGVQTDFDDNGLLLTKTKTARELSYDFSNCPDLAQTVAVVCAAKGIHGKFTGLGSLRIKETDRIAALQNELAKIGAKLEEIEEKAWELIPSENLNMTPNLEIETYDDHRMAMAFAPIAAIRDIKIMAPSVVAKSYPAFWDHMQLVGFKLDFR